MKQRTPSPAAAQPAERPAWQGYGFAGLMLIAALLVRWLIDPYTSDPVPLATIYAGVAFAVWFGGWKPAVALTLIGYAVALWFFLPPRHSFKLWEAFGVLRTGLYLLSCGVTIYLCESLRRERQKHAVSRASVVSILENMHEGVISLDGMWRITSINRSGERALGKSREELLGRTLWDALPNLAGKPAEAELRAALRDGAPRQFETSALVSSICHAITVTPAAGGLSLFFHDVTAQKAHIDQLERLVDDRTAALQRFVSELESFSYTLVHDMRAPLRSISGFAEILTADHADQLNLEGKRHLARIQDSARRMDQLIIDILDYSQLSRSKPELHAVNLDEMLRDIVRSLPDFQPEKATIEIEGVLPTVQGNEALLTQCFSNLLHNATKFIAPGVKPRIVIAAHLTHGRARVDVVDNGIGIAPEARMRIFEPFHRENPAYEGTGIGLAIVRKAVEHLGGRVGVESDPGRGSRFWVELAVANGGPSAAPRHADARVLV